MDTTKPLQQLSASERDLLISLSTKMDFIVNSVEQQKETTNRIMDRIEQKVDVKDFEELRKTVGNINTIVTAMQTRKGIFAELSDLGFKSWAVLFALVTFLWGVLKN